MSINKFAVIALTVMMAIDFIGGISGDAMRIIAINTVGLSYICILLPEKKS